MTTQYSLLVDLPIRGKPAHFYREYISKYNAQLPESIFWRLNGKTNLAHPEIRWVHRKEGFMLVCTPEYMSHVRDAMGQICECITNDFGSCNVQLKKSDVNIVGSNEAVFDYYVPSYVVTKRKAIRDAFLEGSKKEQYAYLRMDIQSQLIREAELWGVDVEPITESKFTVNINSLDINLKNAVTNTRPHLRVAVSFSSPFLLRGCFSIGRLKNRGHGVICRAKGPQQ